MDEASSSENEVTGKKFSNASYKYLNEWVWLFARGRLEEIIDRIEREFRLLLDDHQELSAHQYLREVVCSALIFYIRDHMRFDLPKNAAPQKLNDLTLRNSVDWARVLKGRIIDVASCLEKRDIDGADSILHELEMVWDKFISIASSHFIYDELPKRSKVCRKNASKSRPVILVNHYNEEFEMDEIISILFKQSNQDLYAKEMFKVFIDALTDRNFIAYPVDQSSDGEYNEIIRVQSWEGSKSKTIEISFKTFQRVLTKLRKSNKSEQIRQIDE